MNIETVKNIIEKNSVQISENNPLLVKARTGELSRDEIITYLHNLMYFFRHTPIHLERAKIRAEKMGLTKLAAFFDEKIREETGHEKWASNDLSGMGAPVKDVDLARITAGNQRLLAHAKEIIDRDPGLFIPYMLFMEYFTVKAAPEFLKNLEEKCNFPTKWMTAISYHEQLDKDHVKDDLEILSWSAKDSDPVELEAALVKTIQYVDEFIGQCVVH